jgi:hypothetical protein
VLFFLNTSFLFLCFVVTISQSNSTSARDNDVFFKRLFLFFNPVLLFFPMFLLGFFVDLLLPGPVSDLIRNGLAVPDSFRSLPLDLLEWLDSLPRSAHAEKHPSETLTFLRSI